MGKVKLDLSELKVDSFETVVRQDSGQGTVIGQTVWETNCNCATQYFTHCCPDDSVTSYGSCGTTCQAEPDTCELCGGVTEFGTWCVTGPCAQCDHCT